MSGGRGSGIGRGAARGVIAAMAMTGLRRVTVGLGLVRQPPPEEIASRGVPGLFARVPGQIRDEAVELTHWSYGALAGVAFGLAPKALRRLSWAGPAYGVLTWAFFERVLAPALGLRRPGERPLSERALILADHILYGTVVAARPSRP